MSSTQMDLSPLIIDRKQDIASWPEGDIDQLTTRDKNRYQKRKSAIIEYFQSDLPVEEIAARHRLSAVDSLETMARRCCTSHEDGQQWGFRALVPGARVRNIGEPASSSSDLPTMAEAERTSLLVREIDEATRMPEVSQNGATKKEDTGKHQAVVLTTITRLPVTPVPVGIDEKLDLAVSSAHITLPDEEAEETPEIKREEFPTTTSVLVEAVVEEEVKQEEFPASADAVAIAAEEVVEQEDFPTATSSVAEEVAHVEVEQEEFTTATTVVEAEAVADEEIEQEDFSTTTTVVEETVAEDEVTQEDFPTATSELVETATEEEVAQEDFPTAASVVAETSEEEEEVAQEDFPVAASAVETTETLELAEDEDEDGEPTGKLSVVRPGSRSMAGATVAPQADDEINSAQVPTEQLVSAPAEKQEELAEEAPDEKVDELDEADTVTAEAEVAELDTVEVARVVVEERLNRVAAVETIKVPAAMLEALEQADKVLQTRPAESDDNDATEATDAGTADQTLIVLPDLPEPAQLPSISDDEVEKGDVAAIPTQTLEAWKRDTRQLTQTPTLKSPTQSQAEDSRYRITGSQVAIKHAVRRRWGKQGRQQKYRRWVRIISAAVVVSILVILLIPLGVGLVGYNAYTNIKSVANDGVSNLLALKDLMPANKNDLLSALSPQKLATAKTELQKAQSDFLQLQDMVNRPDIESLLQQFAPQYSGELDMARHLVQVALDVSRMGQELVGVGQMVAPVLHSSGSLLSSSSTTPLFSADEVNAVEAALLHAQYYIGDIQTQMSQVNLAKLPLGNATQKAELAKYLNQIPQAQSAITQAQTLVGPVAWLLGVGQTRHFLIQTLDRAELRPSGGFEGQYGILTLQNGRMSPFTLKDITQLDYAENGAELNRLPPSQYSWMNFGMWGVRDANLSADYPTNAQLVMRVFQEEGGGPIDGDIQFTPVVISQLLQLTGPLYVKQYNETVTAQNLEDKLHYYQQDFSAINVERDKTGTSNASTRKAFTALVGKMLLDRVHSLKISQLMDFSKVLLQDLKTRDLQIYFTNPEAEQWLVQNGYSGAMPKFTNGNDGFMVVQANISISKATQYVHSTFNDQVTLDAQGGATHNLTITLDYNQKGPIYGFDTYTDYVRVYAPANAQFQDGSGFVNTSHTLCTPGTTKTKKGTGTGGTGGTGTTGTGSTGTPTGCGQYNSYYPGGERYCSSGNYSLGTGYVASKGFVPWPVYAPSGPTEMQSDLSGYQMWGGLTQTPKNCTTTIELSWYVPHIVQNTAGKAPYQMIVGHQAGWPDTAKISIDASALKGHVKSLTYNKTINVDTLVALAPLPLPPSQGKPGSTPTPAVTPTETPKKP